METLVVGIGNDFRGDDAAGLLVARRLKALGLPGVAVAESLGDGADLLESWRGARRAILVDAARSGSPPGTIHRVDAREAPFPPGISLSSSHLFGVAEAIELARSLGDLPERLVVYGIEGKSYDLGAGVSAEVLEAADEVVRRLREEISHP